MAGRRTARTVRAARPRLRLEVANRTGRRLPARRAWLRLARLALAGRSILMRPTLLSVAVVSGSEMRRLNRRYRRDRALTDVLAFPAAGRDPETDRQDLGEVVICLDAAEREVRRSLGRGGGEGRGGRFGALGRELALYVLHGILHLVGYNDKRPEERRRMECEQEKLLARWERATPGMGTAARGRTLSGRGHGGAPPCQGA